MWRLNRGVAAVFAAGLLGAEGQAANRSYAATAMTWVGQPGPFSSWITVTGTVTQDGELPARYNYFTTTYQGLAPQAQPLWTHEYAGPAGGSDTPADVLAMGVVEENGGGGIHHYTWVTGSSESATNGTDALTILYDWNNAGGLYHLDVRWRARWDRPQVGLHDQGLRLACNHDIPFLSTADPHIYVLGQTQNAQGKWEYVYLSYDTTLWEIGEDKPMRWSHALDARFFGVANGDSIPAGFQVRNYDNVWYLFRSGRSFGGATGDDMMTTLDYDDH